MFDRSEHRRTRTHIPLLPYPRTLTTHSRTLMITSLRLTCQSLKGIAWTQHFLPHPKRNNMSAEQCKKPRVTKQQSNNNVHRTVKPYSPT